MASRLLVLIVGGLLVSHAWCVSFSLDTWIITLEPYLKKTSQLISLKYIGNEFSGSKSDARTLLPIPVEFSIYPRSIDLDGKVTYDTSKASPEFVIYPAQVILYPGDVQKVQIQWISDKPITKEIVFGLIALQVPVNLEGNNQEFKNTQGGVTILTRYEGIIVVKPKITRSEVVVDTVYSQPDSLKKINLVMHLKNIGSGMQLTKNMRLTIAPLDSKGRIVLQKKITLNPTLSASATKHALFAGQVRRYSIPWPEEIPVGPIQVIPEFP